MKPSRHQRICNRIAIFAMVALLWSQFVLAVHPAHSMAIEALDVGTPTALQHGCEHPAPPDMTAVCAAHCAQSDQSENERRMPPVPAGLPAPFYSIALIATPADSAIASRTEPPVVPWHRPTLHPANILLI